MNDIFVSGEVWGFDWIHLVWVEVGLKKDKGVNWSGKIAFLLLLEPFRGVKDKAQRLGGMGREKND